MDSFILGGIPRSGANSPTLMNQASSLGVERASRSSARGDRENGGFGPFQADFVRPIKDTSFGGHANYGDFASGALVGFTAACNLESMLPEAGGGDV